MSGDARGRPAERAGVAPEAAGDRRPGGETGAVAPSGPGGAQPGASRGRVVWRQLALCGFGPYRDPVRVTFPEGLGIWVAPNETGKSTLVAGLVAVLFGLPGSSDPLKYGQARYRHWHGASRFEGELVFTAADGCDYRIQRDFASHRVRLVRQAAGGPVVEWEGTHNPGASRPALEYEERIARLVGIGSRSLLVQTFCVEQPLAAPGGARRDGETPALNREVQRLLAGAGGASPAAALDHLLERIKQLTRFPGTWGVSSPNLRRDRQLEEVEARIRQLEEAVRRDAQAADDLERVRRRRAELAEERLAAERELARRERLIQAWQEWRRLAEQYRHRVRRRVDMERALERARELEREVEAGRRGLAERWPRWAGWEGEAAADPGPDLDRLVALEQSLQEAEERARTLRRRRLEALARSLLAAWQRYRWLSQGVRGLRSRLDSHPLLAAAGPEVRERLRRSEMETARLAHQVEAAQRELDALEEAWRSWEDEARRLDESYADVRPWNAEMAAAAEEKPALLEQRQRWEAAAREAERQRRQRQATARRVALVVALLAGLAAVALGRAAGLPVPVMPWLAGLVTLGAGWLVHRWLAAPGTAATEAGLLEEGRSLEDRLQRLDAILGPWAQEPPDRLQALARRYREWAARREALEERRSQLPGEEERARGRQRLAEARSRLEQWAAWLAPFRQRYDDPAAALRRWEEEERRWQAMRDALEAFCREEWGALPEEVPRRPAAAAGGPWAAVAAAVTGPEGGAPPRDEDAPLPPGADGTGDAASQHRDGHSPFAPLTVARLAAWLESFDAAFWQEPEQEAARWAALLHQWGLAPAGAGPAASPGDGGPQDGPAPFVSSAGDEVAASAGPEAGGALEAGKAPGGAEVVEALEAVDDALVRYISDQRGGAALAAAEEERLEASMAGLRREVEDLRRRLAPWLEPVGGDAAAAREAWSLYAGHRQALRERERELAGLLAAWQVDDVAGLAARVEQERDAALVTRRDLEALAERHPGLPAVDAPEALAVEETLARWTAEAEQQRERLRSLAMADEELRQREVDYTRAEPINLAAAEVELAELRRRREALQDEIAALVLAHRELQEAVREYHGAYRQRLEQSASGYFARLTGRSGRRVTVDEAFRIGVLEPDGTAVLPGQLSQGARDQLYWSLRLAVADLLAADVRLPFVLDDPFVHCDEERLERIRIILQELAGEGQIVLLSHRRELAGWGMPVAVEGVPSGWQEGVG